MESEVIETTEHANQLLKSGRLREALEICSHAIGKNENDVGAWHILSNIHLRSGSNQKAIAAARRACDLSQNQVFHLIHLGSCFVSAGYTADARDLAEKVLRRNPSNHSDLSNLGALFVACNEHRLGADLFEKALISDNNNAHHWYNLASVQRMLGEIQASLTSINKALAINPADGQAHYLRSDLVTQSQQKNHVQELKDALAAEGQPNSNKVLLGFALAKELEDLGFFSESFVQLEQATKMFRRTINYDVERDLKAIHQIITQHSSEALGSTSQGYLDTSPIFIVGLPRSGTTLVERIVASHEKVASVGEQNFFALEMTAAAAEVSRNGSDSRFELVTNALQINMNSLGQNYHSRVHQLLPHDGRIVDKMPINYLYCGLIHAALPNAQIISVNRDPMDSCYAAYKAFLRGPYPFTYDLHDLGQYFVAFKKLMHHWQAVLPGRAFHEIRYEALINNFETEARAIFKFLMLDWDPSVLDFQNNPSPSSTASASQVRRGLYTSSIGKWRNYAEQLEPLRSQLEKELKGLQIHG